MSAGFGVNRLVPASADSKVPAFGNDDFEARMPDTAQHLCGPIRRMVIHDNHVEFKISALNQGALSGVENCPLTIPNRDDNAGFYWKCFRCSRNFLEVRPQPGTDSFEMRRRDALHFDLVIAIARIHIVELLLIRRPCITHRRTVQRFRNPHDGVFSEILNRRSYSPPHFHVPSIPSVDSC